MSQLHLLHDCLRACQRRKGCYSLFGWLILWLFVFGPSHTWADASGFNVVNQNPFVSSFGLAKEQGATLVAPGSFSASFSYSVASHFEVEDVGVEQIVIDGESTRLEARLFWGLAPGWEVGLEVPYVRHAGGFLDDLIIDWHDWFGLPQNGRDVAPRDRLLFSLQRNSFSDSLGQSLSGVGDVQMFIARSLAQSDRSATAIRGHIKLPTGDENKLLGSGGTDVGLSLHHHRWLTDQFGLGAWLGATYLDENTGLRGLDGINRTWVGQGGVRGWMRLNQRLTLKVQWDVHSQPYKDTRLKQLNEIAYVLSFGGSVTFNSRNVLDIVVVENYPHPEITPDVAFQLNWRHSLGHKSGQ